LKIRKSWGTNYHDGYGKENEPVRVSPANRDIVGLEQDPDAEFEDDWMVLNSMLKTAFGWGESEM
jgi:hypothetical protein